MDNDEKPFFILQGRTKVMEWLKQQPSLSTETDTEETAALTHHKTLKVDQVEPSKGIISRFTNFTVSDSIGIAHTGEMPSLSAMYPGTHRPPLVLSRGEAYTSTLFSGGSRIFPRGVRQLPKLLLFFKFLPKTA